MSTTDESLEMDDRFPSGEWTGFYIQPDSRERHVMDCIFKFSEGSISGEGNDPVGQYTLNGLYDASSAECTWTKQYLGQHGVEYTGEARARGIVGQWQIPGGSEHWHGPFFLWPKAAGTQESAFEKAFVEYELSGPIAAGNQLLDD